MKNKKIVISYYSKKHNFQLIEKFFNEYKEAIIWGKKNLENFNIDMVKNLN